MFLSSIFSKTLSNVGEAVIELYDTDGAQGAARGAAVGAGLLPSFEAAFRSLRKIREERPSPDEMGKTRDAYDRWLSHLRRYL